MDWDQIVNAILKLNGLDQRVVWLHGNKTRVVMVNHQWYQVYDHHQRLPVCKDCKGPDAIHMAAIAVKNLDRKVAVA